ncbi:putative cytochrome-b5 reductase [Rosa chinensis]|uniref:Putative cytochrome-b5 reductase n=1 Tax=Rosa chinensis TaxID=74649 RepID=A0A2P6REX9_ROSCH|nr:putative cytochrome-b5 reductase [Rosa chinensis]
MYPQGRMSHHFHEMCVEDLVVKGPKGCFKYEHGQVGVGSVLFGSVLSQNRKPNRTYFRFSFSLFQVKN